MRIAAGIILIISGMWRLFGLISAVIILSDSGLNPYLPFFLGRIIGIPLLVISGILCLGKKYWRVCLVLTLLAVFIESAVIMAPLLEGRHLFMSWQSWTVVLGGIISAIFVSLTKKEWQEISD